jgi:protein TonB
MFGDVVDPSVKLGTKQWYTVPLSIAVHTAAVLALVVVPLLATDVLPTPPAMMAFVSVAPSPPPPPPPPPPPRQTQTPKVEANPLAAPVEAPPEIKPDQTAIRSPIVDSVVGSLPGFIVGVAEPPVPPPPPPPPPAPIRVGGAVRQPARVKFVAPSYPAIAQSARVQGIVIIEATIGANGRVEDAKVLRSIALLDAAALDAVRQWEYTPTLLNGVPVPVIMTVTVTFTLQ